jgi:hypothetical protein
MALPRIFVPPCLPLPMAIHRARDGAVNAARQH